MNGFDIVNNMAMTNAAAFWLTDEYDELLRQKHMHLLHEEQLRNDGQTHGVGSDFIPLPEEAQPPTLHLPWLELETIQYQPPWEVSDLLAPPSDHTAVGMDNFSNLGAGVEVHGHWLNGQQSYSQVSTSGEAGGSSVSLQEPVAQAALPPHAQFPHYDVFKQTWLHMRQAHPAVSFPTDPAAFINLIFDNVAGEALHATSPGSSAAGSSTEVHTFDRERLISTWKSFCAEILHPERRPIDPELFPAWIKRLSRQSLLEPPTTLDDNATPSASAVGPIRRSARLASTRHTPVVAPPPQRQSGKQRCQGVPLPRTTVMGPFIWDGEDHGYMAANRFWGYLKKKGLVPRRLTAMTDGCKWPGCTTEEVRGAATVEALQKHVVFTHQQFRSFCANDGCEFSIRDNMFKYRHSNKCRKGKGVPWKGMLA